MYDVMCLKDKFMLFLLTLSSYFGFKGTLCHKKNYMKCFFVLLLDVRWNSSEI